MSTGSHAAPAGAGDTAPDNQLPAPWEPCLRAGPCPCSTPCAWGVIPPAQALLSLKRRAGMMRTGTRCRAMISLDADRLLAKADKIVNRPATTDAPGRRAELEAGRLLLDRAGALMDRATRWPR